VLVWSAVPISQQGWRPSRSHLWQLDVKGFPSPDPLTTTKPHSACLSFFTYSSLASASLTALPVPCSRQNTRAISLKNVYTHSFYLSLSIVARRLQRGVVLISFTLLCFVARTASRFFFSTTEVCRLLCMCLFVSVCVSLCALLAPLIK
jgi:hypothetical protein